METMWKNIATWETVRFDKVPSGTVKALFETHDGNRRMVLFGSVSAARTWVRSDAAWKVIA